MSLYQLSRSIKKISDSKKKFKKVWIKFNDFDALKMNFKFNKKYIIYEITIHSISKLCKIEFIIYELSRNASFFLKLSFYKCIFVWFEFIVSKKKKIENLSINESFKKYRIHLKIGLKSFQWNDLFKRMMKNLLDLHINDLNGLFNLYFIFSFVKSVVCIRCIIN